MPVGVLAYQVADDAVIGEPESRDDGETDEEPVGLRLVVNQQIGHRSVTHFIGDVSERQHQEGDGDGNNGVDEREEAVEVPFTHGGSITSTGALTCTPDRRWDRG